MSTLQDIYSIDAATLIRIVIGVPTLYFALILFIRISGKRTTSQMNNFDWIVTVALGSLVATGILAESTTVMASLVAIALLLSLQFVLTWLTIRSSFVRTLVKPRPRLLFYDGNYLEKDMRLERISELEVLAAIRAAGHDALDDVQAVVLETDAKLSVLPASQQTRCQPVLEDVAVATPGIDQTIARSTSPWQSIAGEGRDKRRE